VVKPFHEVGGIENSHVVVEDDNGNVVIFHELQSLVVRRR
jgi:hypothetical protein